MSGYILKKTYDWLHQAAICDILEFIDLNGDQIDTEQAQRILKTSSAFFTILKGFKR